MSPQDDLFRLNWRKAKRSIANGSCVELVIAAGSVAVRDSQDRTGPVLAYSPDTWLSFLREARAGKFDVLFA
jgi:hypothetical protein